MTIPVRLSLLVLAGIAGVAAALLIPTARGADAPVLVGTVGPGFSISLTDESGAPVQHLAAGTYTIQVHDRAAEHDFHLSGPGVDMSTEVEFVGDATWTVTIGDGVYRFVCDPHSSTMNGQFAGGSATLPTTTEESPPPPPKPTPVPAASVLATVGPGFTISFGKKTLKAGKVTIVVRDRSKFHDFHLVGPGVNRRTTVPFTGTATWKLTLRKGVYRFVCDPHATQMRGSFRVT